MTNTQNLIKFITEHDLLNYDFEVTDYNGWILEWYIALDDYRTLYYIYDRYENTSKIELWDERKSLNEETNYITKEEAFELRKN